MSLAKLNIDRQVAAISNLYDVLEMRPYKQIVNLVTGIALNDYKSRVLMAGVGKNANIASKIAETMASLGIPAMPLNVSHMGHGDFGYVGHDDIIIHISRSGTTREMMIAIEHIALIRPGVKQILIHCKPTKTPSEFADIELCIGAVQEGDEHGLAPTTSTTALLCILDCISVEASHAAGFKRLDFLKFHPDGALGEMLKKEMGVALPVDRVSRVKKIAAPALAPAPKELDIPEPEVQQVQLAKVVPPGEEIDEETRALLAEFEASQRTPQGPSLMSQVSEPALLKKDPAVKAYLGQTPDDLADRPLA